jgi:hypothetical protein
MAKTVIDVPPAVLSTFMPAPFAELVVPVPLPVARSVPYFNDTGPPHRELPIFLRQHALLM